MNNYQSCIASCNPKTADLLKNLTGPIRFGMTNAYMFVAVLQNDQNALRHLIAALLHIRQSEIKSLAILNPILLGQAIENKDCVLDILVLLNGNIKINLEMQIVKEGNWNDRAVYYLAENLCDLKRGEDYTEMKKVIQVGILDFNLWTDGKNPFYQEYVLKDKGGGRIFNGKAAVNVLCLPQMENATREDRESGLYDWAMLFRAKTWEELRELAEKNSVMEKTVVTIAELSENEKIRMQCLAREKYERDRINALHYATKHGYEEGMSKGIRDGLRKGMHEGIRKGMHEGIRKGMHEGIRKGMNKGLRKGMNKGIRKGMSKGISKGVKEGREIELTEIIKRMISKGKSSEQIAEDLGKKPEDIRALLEKVNRYE